LRVSKRLHNGFSSTEEGNELTEEDQWKKLELIKAISEKVWGK
jgi:5-methyltetrahydropteroyltriglutamate--homocysteine methyltransferase